MDFAAFITRICDDGEEAARADYARPHQADKLKGSLAGFAEARAVGAPAELAEALAKAARETDIAFRGRSDDYWVTRCRHLEIEWACNVISAALVSQGLPPIITPTARGMMKAADILGMAQAA